MLTQHVAIAKQAFAVNKTSQYIGFVVHWRIIVGMMNLMHAPHTIEKARGLTLAEAHEYVRGALRETRPEDMRARCIDGRYPQGSPAIAMPGWDAGLLAVGLATARRLRSKNVKVSNEEVRDAVFNVIGGKKNFNYHTDAHTMEKSGEARFDGCGHCRLLKMHTNDYLIDEEQGRFFARTLEEVSDAGVQPDVLEGQHAERAVMLVRSKSGANGRTWALDSQAKQGIHPTQVFVYETDLANNRFKALSEALGKATGAEQGMIAEHMSEIAQTQLELTAKALASGLPVYQVTVDDHSGEFTVQKAA